MFKLESYITPILLSYVDKYIKNFKPEDSQLSLWGGEVSLHNLDLRLEVLEEELQLPFTFVSGHIHELIIHVPWTKLYSEPICITINTIECILKLRGEDSAGADGGGNSGGTKERRRRPYKTTDAVAPPGYVQTMVNKIVSNITINCSNLIVKYVEEDIVMSMNVKNLLFQSANEKWEPEFSDFLSSQLMLRKIIKLSDVTVCLDKRNASGKIDSYQEPVLYRCSMVMRWLRCYSSASAHRAYVSRLDILCQKMTFNISEVQVPMVMRLLLLIRALQNKEVGQCSVETDVHIDMEEGDENSHENIEEDSWTGWAWNLVPTLPNWSQDWAGDETEEKGFTFQSGIYIDDLSFNLRVGDSSSTERNTWKSKVEPFLTLSLRGCLVDYTCHDNLWVNSQLGISSVQLEPVGLCSCGISEPVLDKQVHYFESGLYQENYLSDSLFSSTAAENCGEKRRYNFSWDIHQNIFSESSLLEKTPALAIDYLYTAELTEKCSPERFHELNGDLEYSDLPEHALCRTVMGPFVLRVDSGLLHRFDKVRQAAALYDYQPYSSPPPEDRRDLLPAVTTEEYESLEENIPLRTYQYTLFQPKVELYVADHPNVLCSNIRKISVGQQECPVRLKGPCLSFECQCMDTRFISPMYPRRLVRSACLLPTLPQHMFHACHSHTIGRVLGLTSHLSASPESKHQTFSVNNLLYKRKELFFPHLWDGNDLLLEECSIEADAAVLSTTKSQMLLIHQTLSSLMENKVPSYLINDAFTSEGRVLELVWKNINWQRGLTKLTRCDTLTVLALAAALVTPPYINCDGTEKVIIFSNIIQDKLKQDFTVCIQWPLQTTQLSHAPLLIINIGGAFCNLDPLLYAWLLQTPTTTGSANTNSASAARTSPYAAQDTNTQSGRSGGHRKISDVSGTHLSYERNRRSQTPLSVHSSDKDRETVPPPLVSQLSGLRIEQTPIDTKQEKWQLSKWLVHWFPVWQGLVISIDVAQWKVHLPTLLRAKHETLSVPPVDEVCIHLPVVQICNATPAHRNTQVLFSPPSKLPIHLPPSVWAEGGSNFPWNLSLSDLSVWTSCNGDTQYLLKPVTTKCTIGISTRFASSEKDCITSLGLCIHNDTGALHITVNQAQAQVLSNVLLNVMVAARSLCTHHYSASSAATTNVPPAPPSPTTISETASVSESRNLMRNSLCEPIPVSDDPVKLSVWLQWTLARMSVNFYQQCDGSENRQKRTKLALEVEDLMSSLDLQQIYSKLKLKVASANVHHYVRSMDDKVWELSPYQGLVMCGYEEIAPPSSSGQVPSDDGCGLLTATLTRARCRSVHSRWGAPLGGSSSSKRYTEMKVPGHPDRPAACFITEILVKLQPLDFLVCVETLAELGTILHPFTILFEEYNTIPSVKTTGVQQSGPPTLSSASLPLLYLDFQAVRVLMPMKRNCGFHDTLIIQVDSVTLSPHAENPLTRPPIRPDVFHMAEQARILSIPGSEVEDRQYELNITGLAMSTGQWENIQKCRKLPSNSTASSLRTMSENPALVWNTQGDASEIVGAPKPHLMSVLAPLKICVVGAPAIVYRGKILVCGHALEIYAVSDIDVKLTTNQMCLIVNLLSEVQTVLLNFVSKSDGSTPLKPSFVVELAEKQYFRSLQSMPETVPLEHTPLDSGVDTADLSSIETLHSSRMRGARRVSRSPRYLESVHGPSVHSAPSSQSWSAKQERDNYSFPIRAASEQPSELFTSSRSSLHKEKALTSPDQLASKHIDSPFDLFITAGKISFMLHEDVHHSSETEHMPNVQRPLIYVLVTHPHMFYSQFSRNCSIQVSVYNALVSLGSPRTIPEYQPSFSETDFPVVLFESSKGNPDPKTGVLPCLLQTQWTLTPSKPAQMSIDLARPAKFIASAVNLEFTHYILNVISACFTHAAKADSNSVEPEQSTKSLEQLHEKFSRIGAVNFNSVQIIVALEVENEDHITSVLELSVASLCGDLMCTSRTRWGCNVSVVERIVCHLNSNGLCLAASHSLSRQLLLQPCNVEFRLELLWPSWLPRSLIHSLPHTQLTIQSEYVALVVSPDIIKSLTSVCKAYKPYLTRNVVDGNQADIVSTQYKSPSTPGSEVQSNETDSVDTEQPYTDDLRAGAFQFMDATNTMERDQIPLPYQCVFWESSPPAIAWRYPQPRSLTNVHIFPVPFKSAPDAEVGREDAPVVVCSLQYWSECQGAYQHYATFLLSETNESKVVLPTTPSTAVSAVWRVLLAGTRDLHEHGLSVPNSDTSDLPATEVPVVSPRALAACMRVDSFFSASLAPNFQACFNMTVIQVSLMNQLSDSQGHAMPPKLQEYLIDGKVPHDHCFLWLSLNHLALFYSTWPEGRKIAELNSLAQLEILDYASLSQQKIIEPFLSSTCITLSGNDAIDVSVVSRPIAIRIGPSVTHTIAASTNLWLQELGPKITKPTQVLISQYVLCNDTVLPIVVGQAETDEQILLPSRQCHMYSWRSLSKKPVLHLTIMDPSIHQFGKSAWSSHFTIDSLGVHVCKINIPTNREVILFAHVTALSATQKQVTVTGQLQVLNQTDQLLDLRIMRSSSDWSMEACNCLVPLQSTGVTPSLLLDRHADDPQLAIRLRLRQVDASLWTGDIPLKENPKSHQPWLVKVPLQDKQQFICVWCRVIREYVKGERKILVMLSPLYAVRSFLPTSVPATILNDQSEQAKVSLEVKGQGEATLLHLPGALKESTHQLHLRSAANMKIFPFSYSCIDPKKIFTSGDQANIKSVLEASSESKMLTWPLPSSELSSIKWIGIEIDNSYVQAHFSPLSQYSGTMLLELRPWALLLNMLEGNLCIEQSGETVFSMPSRGVVAPPKLEGTFHLGLKFCDSEEWFFSEALQLARPDWGKSFYMPRISGLVPVEGHVQIAVQCGPAAVSLLTLRSQVHCDIRVVSTCSSFIVSNSSSVPLQVTAVAVRHTDLNSQLTVPKKNLPEVMYATRNVPPDRNHKGFPLEKWMHLKSCDVDIVPYMFVSVEDSSHFSCPLRISGFPPRKRFTVPVSHEKGCESSYPAFRSFVLSVVESNGQTFVNIADEPYPQMILHNGCDFRILCAEVSPVGKANNAEFKVIPDASPWDWYCSVDPYCDVGYSAHSVDNVFPQITSTPPNFFIALAVDTGDTKSGHTLLWSPAVQLSGKQEQFISIPGRGDVKVHSWVEGYSTHLSIEAVSRVEICARDIRSRLSAVPEYPVELLDNPVLVP
ncbi:hypothetical protein ONE63_001898 [Megalurothrips usitatus]|uniref:Chorein N-terminal domain-containing protein n=1 Tax=Megalurothrips usitatus TaxID=439358 RepID=A0AAV7XAU5_9NEOP|nr:hypothetical protein ONE63_001898 [Megalurothrips usitatus]